MKYIFFAFIVSLSTNFVYGQTQVAVWEKFDKYVLPDSLIWKNSLELKNQKDDDNNGFVDDIHGISFDENEQIVPEYFYTDVAHKEDYDHGTAVAYILSQQNSNIKIAGVGFVPTSSRLKKSGVLGLSVQERIAQLPDEYKQMEHFVETSINWMSMQGIQVVNMSWGLDLEGFAAVNMNLGVDSISRRKQAKKWLHHFKKILKKNMKQHPNMLFVAAAGNKGKNSTKSVDVLGSITCPNLIIVGALDESQEVASFSNFGSTVTVYASGENISYKKALKMYDKGSGTSLATPIVSAKAAELITLGYTPKEIKKWMKKKKKLLATQNNN